MTNNKKSLFDPTLYRSEQTPCPYVKGRVEQQIFAVIGAPELTLWSDRLNRMGFRRSMNSLYMPMCPDCQACISTRVTVASFQAGRNFRRVFKRNQDIFFYVEKPEYSAERFALFRRYLQARHADSDMNSIDAEYFQQLLETVPEGGFLLTAYDQDARLVAVMMVDDFKDGYSAVYSFYEPNLSRRSIGIMLLLKLFNLAKKADKKYVYLGYYVADASNMAYKLRFKPLQVFDWDKMEWLDFEQGQ